MTKKMFIIIGTLLAIITTILVGLIIYIKMGSFDMESLIALWSISAAGYITSYLYISMGNN
jgi:uncharacterized membrane protein